MLYFKFTDINGLEFYASVTIDNFDKATRNQKRACLEDLKRICHAKTLKVVSKEEYDAQDEEGERLAEAEKK